VTLVYSIMELNEGVYPHDSCNIKFPSYFPPFLPSLPLSLLSHVLWWRSQIFRVLSWLPVTCKEVCTLRLIVSQEFWYSGLLILIKYHKKVKTNSSKIKGWPVIKKLRNKGKCRSVQSHLKM